MIFIHIDSSQGDIEKFNQYIQQGKQIFVLFYMEGCGPCNATRPEWKKLENVLESKYKQNNKIVVADVDQEVFNKIPLLKSHTPSGFPTMMYIYDKGEKVENYEKERTVDSFVEWIESKVSPSAPYSVGGKRKSRRVRKGKGAKKGGKWSQKYKRSINCRRPKGFSQKQYCKYSRNKNKQKQTKTIGKIKNKK